MTAEGLPSTADHTHFAEAFTSFRIPATDRTERVAHGKTLHTAMEALRDKLLEDMPDEERCEAFAREHEAGKLYPNTDYFEWHHRLTGSCLMGRQEFARANNVDMDGSMTPEQFIKLTKNAYGGNVIRMLCKYYEEAAHER